MNQIKEYGQFLGQLNSISKVGIIVKIIPTDEFKPDTKPQNNVEVLKPSKNSRKDSMELTRFQIAVNHAFKNSKIICRNKKDLNWDVGCKENFVNTIINHDYTGIIKDDKIIEFKKVSLRDIPVTGYLLPNDDILSIHPCLGIKEVETFNTLVRKILKSQDVFTKDSRIGYMVGLKGTLLDTLMRSDYTCILTTSGRLVEVKKMNIQYIDDINKLPEWIL